MTDASGQRQLAEAVVDTVHAELPPIWLGGRQRMILVDEITQALTTARQEALREAAERLGVGDSNGLLAAPCLWCGYNGEGYYQAGTHGHSCPWHTIGGCDDRLDRLSATLLHVMLLREQGDTVEAERIMKELLNAFDQANQATREEVKG